MCFVEKLRKLILASVYIQVRFNQKNHKLWGSQKNSTPLTGQESNHSFMDSLISFLNPYKKHELLTQYLKKRVSQFKCLSSRQVVAGTRRDRGYHLGLVDAGPEAHVLSPWCW